ncbi:hypothetical protein SPHG1_21 [Salmonella phage SPHG1]|nr:hypothetical protein SPHG1_21 [Salmonella phage SPHG1]
MAGIIPRFSKVYGLSAAHCSTVVRKHVVEYSVHSVLDSTIS